MEPSERLPSAEKHLEHKWFAAAPKGTSATELVHIGQMVMAYNGTVDDLIDNVFNYPTLAEAYKVAAHDAVDKLELR